MVTTSPRRIGFLCFDGVTALDLVGPLEVFATADALSETGRRIYATVVIGPTLALCTSDSGLVFQPHESLDSAARFDTLMIPGGPGLRAEPLNTTVATWLRRHVSQIRRIASVCTGVYGLAATGLLDGRTAATHWRFAADVARRFPKVRIDANALYLEDPPFYTSAGVTAGVDLALALLEQDHGPALALKVARELVIYFKRPGGQSQYSEPLAFQTRSPNRFSDLAAWLPDHLRDDLSVGTLAGRTNMGARNFARQFKATFGVTPGDYVEGLRLDQARHRLGAANQIIEAVAWSLGFRSADVFRRAFERRFGVSPSAYREHFDQAPRRTAQGDRSCHAAPCAPSSPER
jgi:transcriptional regulator GlxA family with amidase domain